MRQIAMESDDESDEDVGKKEEEKDAKDEVNQNINDTLFSEKTQFVLLPLSLFHSFNI